MAVRGLLRAVSTNRHAAPAPRAAPRMVGEQQRAGRPLTGFHMRKILRADEPRQRLADGEKQRVRRTPPAHGLELERAFTNRSQADPGKTLVALKQTVQRFKLGERLSPSAGRPYAGTRTP